MAPTYRFDFGLFSVVVFEAFLIEAARLLGRDLLGGFPGSALVDLRPECAFFELFRFGDQFQFFALSVFRSLLFDQSVGVLELRGSAHVGDFRSLVAHQGLSALRHHHP